MKIIIAICLTIFGIAFWKNSFRSSIPQPMPLSPDPNAAFCELRPLTSLEREMVDFRSDCLHTPSNFSCYHTVRFPKKDRLVETVKERLEASVQKIDISSVTFPNPQPVSPYDPAVPLPTRTVRPLKLSPKTPKVMRQNNKNIYRKVGSTGLPLEIWP